MSDLTYFEGLMVARAHHQEIDASDVVWMAKRQNPPVPMTSPRAAAMLRRLAREGHLQVWKGPHVRVSWRSGASLDGYRNRPTSYRAAERKPDCLYNQVAEASIAARRAGTFVSMSPDQADALLKVAQEAYHWLDPEYQPRPPLAMRLAVVFASTPAEAGEIMRDLEAKAR